MDKAIKLTVRFILYTLIGSVLGTVLYLMYDMLLQFVPEGIPQKLLPMDFACNYFKLLASTVFVVPLAVINHKLKRQGNKFQCLAYIILCTLSWSLLMPFSYRLYGKLKVRFVSEEAWNPLSENEFRKIGNRIYFFPEKYDLDADGTSDIVPKTEQESVDELSKNALSAVIIDTDEDGFVAIENIGQNHKDEFVEAAKPYRDLLTKEIFAPRRDLTMVDFDFLLENFNESSKKGITFFLGCLSLGFALCSIYGLANIFSWRLMNSSTVIFMTFAVLAFNSSYLQSVQNGGNFLTKSFLADNQIVDFLSKYMDEPFLCIVNLFAGLVFIAVGIVRAVVTKKNGKKSLEGV